MQKYAYIMIQFPLLDSKTNFYLCHVPYMSILMSVEGREYKTKYVNTK